MPPVPLFRLLKPLLAILCLLPLAGLVFIVYTGRTSANPAEDIILTTGVWALRLLLLTLAITPLRRLTGWNSLIGYRRMLGLFAFFYAAVHLASYIAFDRYFELREIAADVAKRPFITAGMVSFLLMVPLAVTSTRGWIRRLGRRWQSLHRIIYISGAAACLHFVWKAKVVIGEPVYYAVLLVVLLAFRVVWRLRSKGRTARQPARA